MHRLQQLLKNGTNLISIIGCLLIFGMIFSGINAMYILLVLGVMNFLYGLYSVITKKATFTSSIKRKLKKPEQYYRRTGICQMILGIYILLMATVYITNWVPMKYFWDVLLVGLLLIVGFWFWIQKTLGSDTIV